MFKTILIVEDHRDFREAVCRFLELNQIKAHVIEACTAEEGISIALRIKPQLVIMDFALRGVNVIEAAQRIKTKSPGSSIIMLTMLDPQDIPNMESSHLIKAFISKNELYDQLLPNVRKVLSHSH